MKDVLGWRQTSTLKPIQAIEEYQRLRVHNISLFLNYSNFIFNDMHIQFFG